MMTTGNQREQTELSQVHSFLLVLSTLCEGGARICGIDIGEDVGGVVKQGIQRDTFSLAESRHDFMFNVRNSLWGDLAKVPGSHNL